jgi:hypothetical protein
MAEGAGKGESPCRMADGAASLLLAIPAELEFIFELTR